MNQGQDRKCGGPHKQVNPGTETQPGTTGVLSQSVSLKTKQSSSASFFILPKDLQMDPAWPLHQTFICSNVQQRPTWFIYIQLQISSSRN